MIETDNDRADWPTAEGLAARLRDVQESTTWRDRAVYTGSGGTLTVPNNRLTAEELGEAASREAWPYSDDYAEREAFKQGFLAGYSNPYGPEAADRIIAIEAREAKLRETVGFFASVIKSGEPWTETCERMKCAALEPSQPTAGGE